MRSHPRRATASVEEIIMGKPTRETKPKARATTSAWTEGGLETPSAETVGEQAGGTHSSAGGSPTFEQIAVRAYQIWEAQGRPNGSDQEHWFEAERQLRAGTEAPPTRTTHVQEATMAGKNKPSNSPASPRGDRGSRPKPTHDTTAEQVREAQERQKARNAEASNRDRMVDIGRANERAGRQGA
jgi:hypothetical protein